MGTVDIKQITISTDVLEAVAKWALPEGESRPYLSQIFFHNDEMIALDAKRAVIVPVKTYGLSVGLWRAHALSAIAAQDAHVAADARITVRRRAARSITIEPTETGHLRLCLLNHSETPSMLVKACTETMPLDELRKIMDGPPLQPTLGVTAFDPSFLAGIDEVTRAIEPQRRGVKVVRWGGELDPVIFESDLIDGMGTGRARFVVMPMRV
jgi:hypothetical protein